MPVLERSLAYSMVPKILCVYVCMCVCYVYAYVSIHVCMCVWKSEADYFECLPQNPSSLFFEMHSTLSSVLTSLAAQWSSQRLELQVHTTLLSFFMWVLKIKTQFLMLTLQGLYLLSYPPSPLNFSFALCFLMKWSPCSPSYTWFSLYVWSCVRFPILINALRWNWNIKNSPLSLPLLIKKSKSYMVSDTLNVIFKSQFCFLHTLILQKPPLAKTG